MKKPTKKEVYARFGIDFDGTYIMTPYGPARPLLKNGNTKLGPLVYAFSLLAGTGLYKAVINGVEYDVLGTCCCDCTGCYAKVGRYRQKNVIASLALNTLLARFYPDFLRRAIQAQIAADDIRIIRIHAAGDFFSAVYIDVWKSTALMYADVNMWTYTKYGPAEHAFDDIKNFNVVSSIIAGKGVNYGHIDYVLAMYEYLQQAGVPVHICRCGIDKNQHCQNCRGCTLYKFVLFIEHSTDYDAKSDPLYPVIVAVINAQKDVNF